ncbi:MAG: 30S ribosomal protein S20 [bacterium]|nr:30S ribosomal protein S20 [bacterium]
MPTRKSGLKHMRADERKRLRNARVKSALRTLSKRYRTLLRKGETAAARALLPSLASALDKAAKRGIIHRNTASRRKSRLSKMPPAA